MTKNKKLTKSHSIVGFHPEGRPKDDFYPTPRIGTLGLLENEKFDGSIWECASGDGSMSNVLSEFGYDVVSTDLNPHNFGTQLDFLSSTQLLGDNIVTNPPFILSLEFLKHALSLGARKVALLNKTVFLEGIERSAYLETTPLKRVLVFKRRLKMTRNGEPIKGGGMISFSWFIWEAGYAGKPYISWI